MSDVKPVGEIGPFGPHDPQPVSGTDDRLRRDFAAAVARFLHANKKTDNALCMTVVWTQAVDLLWNYAHAAGNADPNIFRSTLNMLVELVISGGHRHNIQ